LYDEKKHRIKDICELLGISKQTLYDYLDRRKDAEKKTNHP